jgi:hypothetical protein
VSPDEKQTIRFHELVNGIMMYAENPGMWPLTDEDRISFLRCVIFDARKIRDTELYQRQEVAFAAQQLEDFTKKK